MIIGKQLIEIIKCILNNESVCRTQVTDWKSIISLAQKHKLINLLALSVDLYPQELKPDADICKYLKRELKIELSRNECQIYSANEMQRCFEEQKIYNLVLKGINTKKRYPESILRSMGDIDILYKYSQQQMIKNAMDALGYINFREGRKHDHYSMPPFVEVELHRELLAADAKYGSYYNDIWSRCHPKAECEYTYEMSLEDEFIYNFIHLIEHFEEGGIGIRFIIDIYVYNHLTNLDSNYVETELKNLGVSEFYKNIVLLSEYWFDTKKTTIDESKKKIIEKLELFILSNGLYGNDNNAKALAVEKGGRTKFILKACFPSYNEMCSMFVWLKKHPLLLPYAWMLRAIRSLLYRKNHVAKQFDTYKNADLNRGKELRSFYHECGL